MRPGRPEMTIECRKENISFLFPLPHSSRSQSRLHSGLSQFIIHSNKTTVHGLNIYGIRIHTNQKTNKKKIKHANK